MTDMSMYYFIEPIELIELIKQKPALWDKTCKEHSDQAKRRSAWDEVFRGLRPEYDNLEDYQQQLIRDSIVHKWTNIRDAFMKTTKRNHRNQRKYKYHTHLQFLLTNFERQPRNESIEWLDVGECSSNYQGQNTMYEPEDDTRSSVSKRSGKTSQEKKLKLRISRQFHDNGKPLIELVKQRPILWNRSDPESKDKFKKREAWQEVFRSLKPDYDTMDYYEQKLTGEVIMQRWTNLRDSLHRSLRKGGNKYLYHDEMEFIWRAKYDTGSNIFDHHIEWLEGEEENNPENMDTLHNPEEDTDYDQRPKKKRVKKRKKEKNAIETNDDIYQNELAHESASLVNEDTEQINSEEDEDAAFFISILPSVRTMTEDDKLQFRIDVLSQIKTIKKKYNTNI